MKRLITPSPSGAASARERPWHRRAAALVLALALAAVSAHFVLSGRARVRTERDDGYLAASRLSSLAEVLSDQRTFAYPLLLRAVRQLSPDYRALPHVQAALFMAAVALLFAALVRSGLPPWTALAAALPLAASELLLPFARLVHSDSPGAALTIVAVACLVEALGRRRLLAWIALGLAVFLAYQVRPANLFLVPLVPLLAMVVPGASGGGSAGRLRWRPAAAALAACLLPLVLFAALRLAVVGHFGLVSFGGFNLVGVAGSMLSPEVVAALPAEHRALGRAILDGRRERGLEPIGERSFPHATARMLAWYSEYNVNVWRIAGRAARRQARAQAGPPEARSRPRLQREANRRLGGLALAVFRQRPDLYAAWVLHGARLGLSWSFGQVRGMGASLALLALGAVATVGAAALAAGPARRAAALALARCAPLLAIGWGAFLAGLLLVVLVEPPLERYLLAVALLLPSGFAALGWELLAAAWAAARMGRGERAASIER